MSKILFLCFSTLMDQTVLLPLLKLKSGIKIGELFMAIAAELIISY